ncbi:MAG: hypothetical protein RL745_413, partial [Actinomycetota bacterium]
DMSKVFNADTGMEDFAEDPTPTTKTDIDLAHCRFGGETFRNPCFWILVGVAGTLAVQYIFTKRKSE